MWKDDIVRDFEVLTGDLKRFKPISSYLSWNYHYEFNVAELVFNEVEGSLVKRGKKRGTQYNIELIFQGENNVKDALDFDKSARNSTPWTLTHPFYGNLYVQPIWLTFSNAELNTTKVTGMVIETLNDFGKAVLVSIPDSVPGVVTLVNTNYQQTLEATMPQPDAGFLSKLAANTQGIYTSVLGKMTQAQDFMNQYTAYYYKVNALINNVQFDVLELAGAAQDLITYPAYFAVSVTSRLSMFDGALAILGQDVDIILGAYGLGTTARSLLYRKKQYELNGGAAVAGMCLACVTNVTDDYDYRPQLLRIVQQVIVAYNTYLENLCRLQTQNAALDVSYVPDYVSVLSLQQLVLSTTGYVYNLTASAKQQRTYQVPYDTHIAVVANLLYGMLPDDSTVLALIAQNNISLNELMVLPKGREINYFV